MSSSMSNNNSSDLLTVRAISTGADDELQFSFVDSSSVGIITPSSVNISGRTSEGSSSSSSSSSSNIPIQQQLVIKVATTRGSGDKKLLVDGECFVQNEDQETARSVVEAAVAAACTGQREDDKTLHSITMTNDDNSISRKRNSNCSECDSTFTDKYSCNLEEGIKKTTNDDRDEGVIQKTSTTEYYSFSSPRESKVADQDNHNYHDHHHDDEHDNSDAALIDENDDGFRTPTALEHRIPEIRPCPPPPRKQMVLLDRVNRPSTTTSSNRKLSSTQHQHQHRGARIIRGRRLLDFSKEVESMFPPIVKVNLGRKIKKARTV